ncbi:hypothetical protein PCL_01794 [Purpureocillium lilacinum]|uniref:Uncharacterized protein n=1 Tax=Purpureocillium lilacinum TaxID=33203 RepID=A0A2U3E2H0_PURLI|nr:hypothetical protein PCL_01794 [Purpureocillium lilacinum]
MLRPAMPGSNMKRKQAPVSDEELLVHGSNGQESSHDAGDSALRAKRAHIEADLAALDDAVPPSDNDAETEDLEARRASTHEKYNALKTYKGQYYSGMAVGGSHTWNYDPGVWHEVKQEPDLWKIDFNTKKRRARKAPTGSGAPYVKKTDANTYETILKGSKYKLCHKGAESNSWSVPTVKGQRDREIDLLEDAKRRVLELPPVLASEKVKVTNEEKGQQKLDDLLRKTKD